MTHPTLFPFYKGSYIRLAAEPRRHVQTFLPSDLLGRKVQSLRDKNSTPMRSSLAKTAILFQAMGVE
jgi:hypothetical protein